VERRSASPGCSGRIGVVRSSAFRNEGFADQGGPPKSRAILVTLHESPTDRGSTSAERYLGEAGPQVGGARGMRTPRAKQPSALVGVAAAA
jgi:hypothetical protein